MDIVTDMEITMGYKKALVILPVVLVSYSVTAGKWSLTPSVNITESFTDNLFHTQHDTTSTLITELSPSIELKRTGKQLDASLLYKLANVSYHSDSDSNDTTDYFSGKLNFKLLDEQWLINLSADKSRTLNSLSDGINSQGNFVTPSQSSTTNYTISTSFTSAIPDILLYDIDLKANKISGQSQDQFNNKKAVSSAIMLNNTRRHIKSYWNVSANRNQIFSDDEANFERQVFRQYTASMGWNFIEDYWVFLQYSEQDNDLGSNSTANIESSSYGVGLRWFPSNNIDIKLSYNKSLDDINSDFASVELTIKPSKRTQLYLTTGKRFYGDYYDVQFSYRLKRFSAVISYHEEISSYNISQFQSNSVGNLICPAQSDFNINDCYFSSSLTPVLGPDQQLFEIDIVGAQESQSTTLDKRLTSTFTYTKRRVNLVTTFVRSIRYDLDSQGESHDNSIVINAGYRLNKRSNLSLTLSYLDSTTDKNQASQAKALDKTLAISYSRKLAKDAIGLISLSRYQREATGTLQSYDENRILISFTQEF